MSVDWGDPRTIASTLWLTPLSAGPHPSCRQCGPRVAFPSRVVKRFTRISLFIYNISEVYCGLRANFSRIQSHCQDPPLVFWEDVFSSVLAQTERCSGQTFCQTDSHCQHMVPQGVWWSVWMIADLWPLDPGCPKQAERHTHRGWEVLERPTVCVSSVQHICSVKCHNCQKNFFWKRRPQILHNLLCTLCLPRKITFSDPESSSK